MDESVLLKTLLKIFSKILQRLTGSAGKLRFASGI